jgi:hypothetical protein
MGMTSAHTFVVSPLERCSSGILGRDFLQRVEAEISLTAQLLYIGRYSTSEDSGAGDFRRSAPDQRWADGIPVL